MVKEFSAIVSIPDITSPYIKISSIFEVPVVKTSLVLSSEVFDDISDHELLEPDSAFDLLKKEVMEEYQKASVLNEMFSSSLHR